MTTQPSSQVQTQETKRPQSVVEMLSGSSALRASIANALPSHITPDRMARVCLTALRRNPKLQQAKPESLLAAIMVCSQLGLEPNDPRGQAYLIPYKDECQLIIGYRGMIDLAMRSGMVENIQALAVYERDQFEYEQGLEMKLRHVPYLGTEDPGKLVCTYAIASLRGGSKAVVVMPLRDIERARKASSGVKSGRPTPWDDWYEAMAIKTAVRKLAKFMPQSPEFARALEVDDAQRLTINPLTLSPDDVDITPAMDIDGERVEEVAQAQQQDIKSKLAAKVEAAKPVAEGQSRFGGEA